MLVFMGGPVMHQLEDHCQLLMTSMLVFMGGPVMHQLEDHCQLLMSCMLVFMGGPVGDLHVGVHGWTCR